MNVWLVLQEKYLTACASSENSDHTARNAKPGPEVIKLFSCSTQLSMKFFLLINVKMPTIVGILTFMNGKNSILGLSEPKKKPNFLIFYPYEHFKILCSTELSMKKVL